LLFFNFQLFSEHVFSVFPTCFNRGAVSNFHVLMVYPRNLLTTPLKSRIFPKSAWIQDFWVAVSRVFFLTGCLWL
jgi:hypothetical protein